MVDTSNNDERSRKSPLPVGKKQKNGRFDER